MNPVVKYACTMKTEVMDMAGFVPLSKMSKKARKERNREKRTLWSFSPVTRKVESKKRYNRRKKTHDRYDDYGMGFSLTAI